MTRAMRETREEAEMYKYDKVYYFKTRPEMYKYDNVYYFKTQGIYKQQFSSNT